MKNIGLNRLENVNVDKFTNTCKMKIRRALFPLTRFIVKANTKLNSSMDIVVDNRPELDKDPRYRSRITPGKDNATAAVYHKKEEGESR